MAKRDIDIVIKARDEASKVFQTVGRTAAAEAAKMNRINAGGTAAAAAGRRGAGAGASAAFGAIATKAALGTVAAGATVATAVLIKSTQAAVEFETTLAQINTMLSGDSTATLAQYRTGLQNLAKEFGQSTTVLGAGLYDLLSAGIPAGQALDVLAVATRAAIGGNTDAATSVDGLTAVLNAYKLEASAAGTVTDVMFQIVKDGKINFPQLAQNISTIAPLANAAGVAFDDLGGIIATAVKVEKPERAMTQIAAVMRSASKEGTDFLNFLKQFEGQSLDKILASGVDSETAKGIALLGSDIAGLEAEMAKMKNSTGAAGEAFDKMAGTPKFKIDQIKQSFVALTQNIGKSILESEWFGKALDNTLSILQNLPANAELFYLGLKVKTNETAVAFRETWLSIKQFFGNIIDSMSDRFGGMIANAGAGLEALANGDFKGAAEAAKNFAVEMAKTNVVSIVLDAKDKTTSETGKRELDGIFAGDALLQGMKEQVAEDKAARTAVLAKLAEVADKQPPGERGDLSATSGGGPSGGGPSGGQQEEIQQNAGGIISRFLTGATFQPVMVQAADKIDNAGEKMLAAAEKIANSDQAKPTADGAQPASAATAAVAAVKKQSTMADGAQPGDLVDSGNINAGRSMAKEFAKASLAGAIDYSPFGLASKMMGGGSGQKSIGNQIINKVESTVRPNQTDAITSAAPSLVDIKRARYEMGKPAPESRELVDTAKKQSADSRQLVNLMTRLVTAAENTERDYDLIPGTL